MACPTGLSPPENRMVLGSPSTRTTHPHPYPFHKAGQNRYYGTLCWAICAMQIFVQSVIPVCTQPRGSDSTNWSSPPGRIVYFQSTSPAGVVRATQFMAPGPAIHNYSPALCICTYIYFRDHFIGLHFAAIPGVFSDPEFRHRVTLEWALALYNPSKPLLCCSDCLFFSRFH